MTARPQRTTDAAPVAAALADAFAADPLFAWVFADPASRRDSLETWWGFLTAAASETGRGELWTVEDGAAAALWYPPVLTSVDEGHEAHDTGGDEESEDRPDPFVEMLSGLVGGRLDEVQAAFSAFERAHPEEPHWYLPAVGTRVRSQGRGLGAQLLRPVLDRCDRQGLGAYLESSNIRNLPFYHRLGFEVRGEILVGGEVIVTTMWRRPR